MRTYESSTKMKLAGAQRIVRFAFECQKHAIHVQCEFAEFHLHENQSRIYTDQNRHSTSKAYLPGKVCTETLALRLRADITLQTRSNTYLVVAIADDEHFGERERAAHCLPCRCRWRRAAGRHAAERVPSGQQEWPRGGGAGAEELAALELRHSVRGEAPGVDERGRGGLRERTRRPAAVRLPRLHHVHNLLALHAGRTK